MTVEQLEALASAHQALAAAYTTVAQEMSDEEGVEPDEKPAAKKGRGKSKKAAAEEKPAAKKGRGKGKKKPEPEPEPEDEDLLDDGEEEEGEEEITKATLTKMVQEISALGKKATADAKAVFSEYGVKNLKALDEDDYVDCYNDLVEVFNEHAE